MIRYSLSFLLLIIPLYLAAQETTLPHYMTDEERALYENYQPPVPGTDIPTPPPTPVRAMAEWEDLAGLMITWTTFYSILSQIVDYAQEEGQVYIVCSDSNSVRSYLNNAGVPITNIVFLETAYNTIWIRDYGPWTVYAENTDSLYIIDWIYNRPRPLDDVIPAFFANYINAPIYEATVAPYDLVHAGGNFMVDGHGTAFSSKLIFEENPGKSEAEIDAIMQSYLGIDRYIKMETLPYDVIHHIDMHIKLLDEETLLVGQYPPGVADGPQIEANLQYILNNFETCYGRPFKVVRIPMPPDQFGQYPNNGGDYRTYTNSIIINKTVIMPTYEYQYDTTAFRIYREAMPGYNIVGINSNSIIPLLGAIHCIVKEVGVRNPIFISHASLETAVDTSQAYDIEALIQTNSGIDHADVFWSADTTQGFSVIPMVATGNDSFFASIPAQAPGSTVYYYISVQSNDGRTLTKPRTAPAWSYEFDVEIFTDITAGNQTNAERLVLHQNYPNPFNPSTQIAFDLQERSHITLKIYNIQGEQVKSLTSGLYEAGHHIIQWNGRDRTGNRVSSGIYIYRLETEGAFSKTRKMVLLK